MGTFVGTGIERHWAARELIAMANHLFARGLKPEALLLYGRAAENLVKALLIVRSHVGDGRRPSQLNFDLLSRPDLMGLVRECKISLTPLEQDGLEDLGWVLAVANMPSGMGKLDLKRGLPEHRQGIFALLGRLELELRRTRWFGSELLEDTDLFGLK